MPFANMPAPRLVCLAATACLAGTPALAEPIAHEFDKTHTSIRASWDHWGLSRQAIEFTDYSGTLMLDFEAPENSSIDVTFDLAGMQFWAGAPEDEKFEEHLASADLFDTEAFPAARFVADSFETENGETGTMSGQLTLKDETHPVTLDVTLNGRSMAGKRWRAGFSARGTLERSDWGLGFGAPNVSDEIQLSIETELMGPVAAE